MRMRRMELALGVLVLIACPSDRAAAAPQIFGPPITSTQQKKDLFGVRYRAFGIPYEQDTQIFLGLPNLADGTNTRGKYRWDTGQGVTVSHRFSLTWDRVNDKLISVMQRATPPRASTTLEFTGLAAKVASKFPGFTVDDVNLLSFVVANRDQPSNAAVNDIVFDGVPLGSVTAPGFNTFNGIGIDFSQGFTLTGTLVLSGPFGSSRENSRVEILAGVAECTADADCDDRLACNGQETCDLNTLRCAAGTPVTCDGACDTGTCIDPDGQCEQLQGCPTTTTSTSTTTTTVSPTTTTTDPEQPTTTTSTSTSTTVTLPPPDPCANACGNGVIDTACGEVCDAADLGGATCPAARPVGTPVCTAACRRIDYTPCMPAPPQEICGNCFDDDANGLTDFEDPACCATTFDTTITCSRLTPKNTATKLQLRGLLNLAPGAVPPDLTEVFIQLRQPGGAELLCSRVPAGDFVAVPKGFNFKDPKRTVETAQGVDQIIVRARQQQTLAGAFGQRAEFVTPPPGPLVVTLGFLSRPTSPQAGVCSTTTAEFIPGRGSALVYPNQAAANACRPPSKPPSSSGHGCD
jgi:hypothetical protein